MDICDLADYISVLDNPTIILMLVTCIVYNPKSRFNILLDVEPQYDFNVEVGTRFIVKIGAHQGHSSASQHFDPYQTGKRMLLKDLIELGIVYHVTDFRNWKSIMDSGLQSDDPMSSSPGRLAIHLLYSPNDTSLMEAGTVRHTRDPAFIVFDAVTYSIESPQTPIILTENGVLVVYTLHISSSYLFPWPVPPTFQGLWDEFFFVNWHGDAPASNFLKDNINIRDKRSAKHWSTIYDQLVRKHPTYKMSLFLMSLTWQPQPSYSPMVMEWLSSELTEPIRFIFIDMFKHLDYVLDYPQFESVKTFLRQSELGKEEEDIVKIDQIREELNLEPRVKKPENMTTRELNAQVLEGQEPEEIERDDFTIELESVYDDETDTEMRRRGLTLIEGPSSSSQRKVPTLRPAKQIWKRRRTKIEVFSEKPPFAVDICTQHVWKLCSEGVYYKRKVNPNASMSEKTILRNNFGDYVIEGSTWQELTPAIREKLRSEGVNLKNWRACPLSGLPAEFVFTAFTNAKEYAMIEHRITRSCVEDNVRLEDLRNAVIRSGTRKALILIFMNMISNCFMRTLIY